jgi:hypothetical protein
MQWFEQWWLSNLLVWPSIILFNWGKSIRFALARKVICGR